MKKYLYNLEPEIKELIGICAKAAAEGNYRVYLVGGFVRDLVLGVKNLDLDIVVEGDGIKYAEDLSTSLKAGLVRHRRFGTATLTLGHKIKIDIATAREECYPEPACLPSVKSGKVKDDLKRRDFSINAMAISLNQEDYGKLVDFFNGLDDLAHKRIRILHNLSFIDDPTRILRAIRFEKRYNFKIEPLTLKHLREAVKLKMLERVEPQRLRDEMILILKEADPLKLLKRIQQLAGFKFIHPRLGLSSSIMYLLGNSRRQISWFKKHYPNRRHLDTWLVYFASLLDGLTIKEVKAIFKLFVFRKGEEKRVLTYKEITKSFIDKLSSKDTKPSAVFHLLDHLSYEVILLVKAKYKNKNLNRHIKDFFESYNSLRLVVTGHDLSKLGIKPGPEYQKIFLKVLNAKLDNKLHTKTEELDFIKKITKIK